MMTRSVFVKKACVACIGVSILGLGFPSCSSVKTITGEITNGKLIVPLSEFKLKKENKYRSSVIVHHVRFQYPICVFRLDEGQYSALLMRCPHKGTELQVFGSVLQCPSHGSEFDTLGNVQNPPALDNLTSFPTSIDNFNLIIHLA